MSPRRVGIGLAAAVVAVIGAYLGVCWFVLATLITPERKPHDRSPAELGFDDVRGLAFRSRTGGVPLRGWLVGPDSGSAVVLVHGLHSHAWDCQTPDLVRAYVQAGFQVLLFDLRGHGASGGDHAGLGLLERGDVRAAVDLLLEEGVEPGRIVIHGVSYGAAVALLAAAGIEAIGAVIADSSFADVRDVIGAELARRTGLPPASAGVLMPGLRLLARAVYGIDIADAAPEEAIGRIAPRPILLIHGTADPVIPYEHAERLKAAAGPAAELWPIEGAGHTQGVRLVPECGEPAPTREAYLRRVVAFFDRHLRARDARRSAPRFDGRAAARGCPGGSATRPRPHLIQPRRGAVPAPAPMPSGRCRAGACRGGCGRRRWAGPGSGRRCSRARRLRARGPLRRSGAGVPAPRRRPIRLRRRDGR